MQPRSPLSICKLIGFLIIVFSSTVILYRLATNKADFRDQSNLPEKLADLVTDLKKANPEYIIVGDSMLTTRMDPEPLSKLSGRKFFFYSRGGASTAAWYLYLKNAIIGSGVKPRAVIFIFRNQYLTWPRFRVNGMYRANIDRVSLGEDPLVNRLLQPDSPQKWDLVGWARYWLNGPAGLFYSKSVAEFYEHKLENLALDLSSLGEKKDDRRLKMTRRFNLTSLRADLAAELPEEGSTDDNTEDARPRIFDPSPGKSFLPHIVELGREHHLPLFFFRVKCRPLADNTRPQTPELQKYIADLSAWLTKEGCLYFDETNDPKITLSIYHDGDHVSDAAKPWWTEYFWQRIQPLLP